MSVMCQSSTIDTSKTHREVKKVSKFKDLREQTGWSVFELAKEAQVSPSTVNRMEYNYEPVTKRMAYRVLNTIGQKIGRSITIEEIEGLRVK